MRAAGMTLEAIGTIFGVSRERIRQVLVRWDMNNPPPKPDRTLRECANCKERYRVGTYNDHAKEKGHPVGAQNRRLSPESEGRDEYIVSAYQRGDRIADISRTVRTTSGKPMTYHYLYRILRQYGIEPNRGGGSYVRTDEVKRRMSQGQTRRAQEGPAYKARGWRADE